MAALAAASGGGFASMASSYLPALGSFAGGMLGFSGAKDANKNARKMQEAAHNFEREVLKNRYVWQTQDMKNAGINPMLSAGASPPMGHGVTMPVVNEGQAAAEGASSGAQVSRNNAESRLLDAQEKVALNTAMREAAQAELASAQAVNQRKETDFNFGDDTVSVNGSAPYGFRNLQMSNLYSDMELTKTQAKYVNELRSKVMPEIQKLMSEGKLDDARTELTKASAEAERLGLPQLRNEAAAQSSPWKKDVAPYLDDLGKVTNSAGNISRIRRSPFEFRRK